MLAQERYDLIARVLLEKSTIKVSEVMQLCNVSHETARRDLETLQENGLAKRVHGGAVLIPQDDNTSPIHGATPKFRRQFHAGNLAAAQAAAKLVRSGSTILLDGGRTMAHLAHYVRDIHDLSVVTPSLLVINELSDTEVNLYSLGGSLSHEEYTYYGKITSSNLSLFNVDIAFISCAGLDTQQGYITDYDDLGLSRSLIHSHAEKLVLVISSEKLHTRAFSNVYPISQVDTIVVDERLSSEDEEFLRSLGSELIIAPMIYDPADEVQDD